MLQRHPPQPQAVAAHIELHLTARQAASSEYHVGVAHAARPLRNPSRLRLDAILVRIARAIGAALAFVGVGQPYHATARVDGSARKHASVSIEKFQLTVAHTIDRTGFRAIRKMNVKSGVRGRVPIAETGHRGCGKSGRQQQVAAPFHRDTVHNMSFKPALP